MPERRAKVVRVGDHSSASAISIAVMGLALKEQPLTNVELQYLREQSGITIDTMANVVCLTPRTVRRIEDGRSKLAYAAEALWRLAAVHWFAVRAERFILYNRPASRRRAS